MSENSTDNAFLLQNLMEHMTDHIYFKDLESHFIMVNKAFCEWTGFPAADVIGKTDFDLFASAHAQQAFDDEQEIIRSREPIVGIEEKETWADGRITWVSSTKMPLKNAEGAVVGTFGISRDITEHKEAELRATYYSEQAQRIKEEMEEDVRMAAELQKTFFPRSYPTYPRGVSIADSCVEFIHHYHASGTVSGDFCSIIPVSPTEAGVFLCDVMGHGVRAALVTALICALVEETSSMENDPGRFLARMNKQLLPILRQEDMFLYATACYMVYNAETGQVRYANAGHPVPIHIHSGGQTAEWLMADPAQRGPALAIVEEMDYQTFYQAVAPGDSVLAYTDGLYEVLDGEGHEFGEQRLLQSASQLSDADLKDLVPGLIGDAAAYAVDGVFDDDICVAGFRCHALMDGEG